MARKLEDQTNVEAPSADFPSGRIKNDTGTGDGTPVSEALYGDIQQFFAKLFRDASVVENGLPDNTTNGFQMDEALNKSVQLAETELGWLSSGITLGVDVSEIVPVQYRRIGNRVEWRGVLQYTGALSTFNIITQHTSSTKPTNAKFIPVGVSSSGDRLSVFSFSTSSNITVLEWANPGTGTFTLDGINYWIS